MRRFAQIGLLTAGVCLGLAATIVLLSSFAVAAGASVDLIIRGTAPNQVDVNSTYVVNVSFANKGGVAAPDNWVRVTLPAGTAFVGSTYTGGTPRPPDEIDGQVLTWYPKPLVADSTWSHILIEIRTAADLAEGTELDVVAEIGGSAAEANTNNNVVTVTSTVQDMGGSQKQVHVRTAMPADVLEYTITVDLPADAGRQYVTVIDELPPSNQVRFLGWDGSPSGTLIDGHRLRWEGWVEPDEPVQLRYRLGVKGDVPPGTMLSNRATVEWPGNSEQLGPVTTEVEVPYGVLGVGPDQGGQVQHHCGATLTVPPGAVQESTRFQVGPIDAPGDAPVGWQYANRAFEINAFRFGEPVRQFNAPLVIAVEFSEEDVAGLNRETLRLWTREGPDGPWAMMDEPVRTQAGMLIHTTTHLSEFALFGEAAVDLQVRAMAPEQVDVDSTYVVNVSYANKGSEAAPDNWLQVTLPEGTQFMTSTYIGGEPRPPDEIDGQVLSWTLNPLPAFSTWGHVLVEVGTDAGLAEGTELAVVAEVGGSAAESDTENNTVTVTSTVLDMGGTQKRAHNQYVRPADDLEYTLTIELPGPGEGPKQTVNMTDTLPARNQVRFLGWEEAPGGVLTEGHKLRWTGELEPGEQLQFRYRIGVEGDVAPGTIISNVAAVEWGGRRLQLGPVATVVTVPHGTMGVGPGQGGQVEHRYGVTLTVPPGAVQESTGFEIVPLDIEKRPITPPNGLSYANRAFEMNAYRFGEPVRQFNAPVTITLRYSETDVIGLRRETLRLWTREGPEGPWQTMGEPARTMSGTLEYTTTHFSEFALFGEAAVDLQVRAMAPEQVDAGSSYVVNVSCANKGQLAAPDNWLRVTLPEGTTFVTSTYTGGDPRPPDEIDGRVLTWNLAPLVADSTWSHVLVEVGTDAGLADGTTLAVLAEVGGSAVESDMDNNTQTVTSTIKGTVVDLPHRLYLPLVVVQ